MKILNKLTSTLTSLVPKSFKDKGDLSEENVNYILQDVKAKWFFGAIFLALSIAVLYTIRSFLGAMFMAGLLALLMHPWYNKIKSKTKLNQKIVTTIMIIILIIMIIIPVLVVSIGLLREATKWISNDTIAQLQSTVNSVAGKLPYNINSQLVAEYTQKISQSVGSFLIGSVTSFLGNLSGFLVQITIFLAFYAYLIPRISTIARAIITNSPLGRDITRDYLNQTNLLLRGTVVGSACVSFTAALIMGVMFQLLGVPSPLLFSTLAFIIGFIPYLGTGIFTTLIGIIYAILGDWQTAAIIIGVQVLIINQIDLIFRPITLPKKVRIHPALTTLAVLAGISAFGVIGLFYGLLILVLFISSIKIYQENFVNNDPAEIAKLKPKG